MGYNTSNTFLSVLRKGQWSQTHNFPCRRHRGRWFPSCTRRHCWGHGCPCRGNLARFCHRLLGRTPQRSVSSSKASWWAFWKHSLDSLTHYYTLLNEAYFITMSYYVNMHHFFCCSFLLYSYIQTFHSPHLLTPVWAQGNTIPCAKYTSSVISSFHLILMCLLSLRL